MLSPIGKQLLYLNNKIIPFFNITCNLYILANLLQPCFAKFAITDPAGIYWQGISIIKYFIKLLNRKYLPNKGNWCILFLSI